MPVPVGTIKFVCRTCGRTRLKFMNSDLVIPPCCRRCDVVMDVTGANPLEMLAGQLLILLRSGR